MKTKATNETATPTQTDRGLTSEEIERATDGGRDAELHLNCSDLACHIATSEFELMFLCSN